MLPDNTSQAPDDPAVQGLEYVPCFSQAVIVPPSSEVHIQLFNDLGEAEPAVPVCKFPNPFFKALDCFPVYADFGLATHTDKCVSQKLVQPGTADFAFLLIDLEPEFYSYEACDTLHNPLRRFLTSKVYDKIIRIPDKSMTSALQFLVQLVQDNVGKYRRKWAALCKESNYAKQTNKFTIIQGFLADLLSIISINDD